MSAIELLATRTNARDAAAMQPPEVAVMIRGWDLRTGSLPSMAIEAARRAEQLGLDGVVAGDHVTFYGYGNDALITLTAIAAVTERVALRTGVYLLPLRHPVPVALQAAQLDQLSMGRLVLGIGVGGEDRHEFTSSGVDPAVRGERTDEALQILARLWTEDGVTFAGRQFALDAVTLYPKPFRQIPLLVGGRSDAALRRAGRFGDGYTGIWLTPGRFAQSLGRVGEFASEAGRETAGFDNGMQFWTSVAPDRDQARATVGEAMEGMYQLPFERFERYTPYGTAAEVAERLMPFVEAEARHINLICAQDSQEESVERAAEVRDALHALCRAHGED